MGIYFTDAGNAVYFVRSGLFFHWSFLDLLSIRELLGMAGRPICRPLVGRFRARGGWFGGVRGAPEPLYEYIYSMYKRVWPVRAGTALPDSIGAQTNILETSRVWSPFPLVSVRQPCRQLLRPCLPTAVSYLGS